MADFTVYNTDNAPEGSQPFLAGATEAYGFTPNLLGVLSESPATIEAYVTLSKTISEKTDFSPTEQQIVLLTASYENGCTYCMAAHSTVAGMSNVPADVVESLRTATPIADAKLNALAEFTRAVVQMGGWLDDETTQKFLDAGYTQRHILEVILGVALKTISNYSNHFAHTPVDPAFEANTWAPANA